MTSNEPSGRRLTDPQVPTSTEPAVSGKSLGSLSLASTPGRATVSLVATLLTKPSALALGALAAPLFFSATTSVTVAVPSAPVPVYVKLSLPLKPGVGA